MHEPRLPPLGFHCCDPSRGYEGCCGLFVKMVAAPTPAQPCGQCAHLVKTVEELQRQLAIETDTANRMILRVAGEQSAFMNGFMAGQSAESRKAQGLNSVAPTWSKAYEVWKNLRSQTSAQAPPVSDSVVAEGVTAGEAASQDLNTHLHDASGLRPVAEKPDGAYCCSTPCVCGANCGLPVGETPALLDALKGLLALSKRELADPQDCDAIRVAEDAIDHAEGRWTPEIPAIENAMEDCRVCSRPFGDPACDHRLKR